MHNFLFLCRVALLHNFLKELERDPRDQRANGHLETEGPVHITHLEVLSEQRDRANVDYQSKNDRDDHELLDASDLGQHVEHLDADERGEGDADDVDEGLVELSHGNKHDQASLYKRYKEVSLIYDLRDSLLTW